MYRQMTLLVECGLMFTYDHVKKRSKLLLAMTSVTQVEFEKLLVDFHKAWDIYGQQEYRAREGRQRHYGGGRPEATLISIEDKLLFILYSIKVYPLQESLAFALGMAQSTAHEWIHILSEVLKKALDEGDHIPERSPQELAVVLPTVPSAIYGIDGTERRRQRPSDPAQQADYYRGKKNHIRSRILFLETSRHARSIT